MAPVDRDKLRSHVDFIRRRVRTMEEIASHGRGSFLDDDIVQTAAVRYLHTAIEAMIDIANHVVARRGLGVPTTYRDAMDLLSNEGIVPEEMRETLRRMVAFRNRAVHLYDEIDADEVYEILTERLGDFDDFVSAIAARFFASPPE